MRARRFTKGRALASEVEAVLLILGGRWLYFRHKVLSPRWLENWSLVQIRSAVANRALFIAIPTGAPTSEGAKETEVQP